jgi:uncharacterized membrane protein YccC
MPQVKSDRLDAVVWNSVLMALNNPQLLINQIPKLLERKSTEAKDVEQARLESAQQLERLKEEENRLLEAYATKVLTLEQLQDYMTKLKGRIQEAEKRLKSLQPANDEVPVDPTNPETTERFLKTIAAGVKAIEGDFARKQRFIKLLVDKVIMEKGVIRIKVFLPSDTLTPDSFFCQIESTAIAHCVRRRPRSRAPAWRRIAL